MENLWIAIVSAIISGLLATIITIFVNKRKERLQEKKNILSILLSYRYDIANINNVNALNRIQMVFYDNDDVLKAWDDFNITAQDKSKEAQIIDKYLKLVECVSYSSGYKKLKWDKIKTYYFPEGLSKKMLEENMIRSETLKKINMQSGNNVNNSQVGLMFVMELLKQQDGIEKITKLLELSKKEGK